MGRHMTDLFEPHKHRHNRDPETSHAAAEQAASFAAKHRAQVYGAIRVQPRASEEIAYVTGLGYQQVLKRISDLHNEGWIEDSGRRHRNSSGRLAVVWQLAGAPPLFHAPKPKRKTAEQIREDALEEAAQHLERQFLSVDSGDPARWTDHRTVKSVAAVRALKRKAQPKPG